MNEPTLEEELYSLPQDEIDGLKERLAMLSRNVRAKGLEVYRFQNYEIGEDLETGNLSVDLIKCEGRNVLGVGHVEKVYRTAFLMIDRQGNLMVRSKYREQVKQLSQGLILVELAAI